MRDSLPFDRRTMLSFLALAAVPLPSAAQAQPQPGLLVACPPGGRLDRWAEPISATVGRALPSHTPLLRRNLGGLDGVTGANRFEARAEADGTTALLVPGAATLSWLVGETRAKFDPARWLLLWATTASAVLVSRVPLESGRIIRISAANPVGPELPVLLALDLVGIQVALSSPQEADAFLLQGTGLPGAVQAASVRGMNPVLTLGHTGEDGQPERDPLLPSVPTVRDITRNYASPRLAAALFAASSAVQLDAGLILPQLTPADAVANWRRACQPLQQNPEVLAEAGRIGARLLPADKAADLVGHIAGDPDILLSLRQWLATRYGWRPA